MVAKTVACHWPGLPPTCRPAAAEVRRRGAEAQAAGTFPPYGLTNFKHAAGHSSVAQVFRAAHMHEGSSHAERLFKFKPIILKYPV